MPGRTTARSVFGVAAVLLVLTYVVAVLTVPGQWLDDQVFGWAQDLPPRTVREVLPTLARVVLPPVMLVLVGASMLVGCVRRRWPQVLAALAVVAISAPLARWLRWVLPRPDHGYSYVENTLPSTHVALVTAGVVAVLILWRHPGSWSLLALLPGALVVWISCIGSVVGYAHRPSDAVAAVLLVLTVSGGAVVVADLLGGRAPDTVPR